jgi:hypothetical protein
MFELPAEIAEPVPQFPDWTISLHLKLRVAVRRPDLLIVPAKGIGLLPRLFARRQVIQFG